MKIKQKLTSFLEIENEIRDNRPADIRITKDHLTIFRYPYYYHLGLSSLTPDISPITQILNWHKNPDDLNNYFP